MGNEKNKVLVAADALGEVFFASGLVNGLKKEGYDVDSYKLGSGESITGIYALAVIYGTDLPEFLEFTDKVKRHARDVIFASTSPSALFGGDDPETVKTVYVGTSPIRTFLDYVKTHYPLL